MKTPRTFPQIVKRFLEPVKSKSLYAKAIAVAMLYNLYAIYSIYILQAITASIESAEEQRFRVQLVAFSIVTVVFYVTVFFARKSEAWPALFHENVKQAHKIYMDRFISLDNNKAEGIGTGRLISIIDKGFFSWSNLMVDTIQTGLKTITAFGFASYMVYRLSPEYFLGFFCTFFVLIWIISKINDRAIENRRPRIEAINSYSHQLVKMIMSKFEILQNSKTVNEVGILDRYIEDAKHYNYDLNKYLFLIFNVPKAFIALLRIGIYVIVGDGIFHHTLAISDLVWLMAVAAFLDFTLSDFVNYFKNVTKDYASIEKLWDLFDEIPQIQGYDTGNAFEFRKGDIELRNLSYTYTDDPIFSNFSLSIAGGKKTALVGLSGSGKSTLVKLIAGYLHPTGGSIVVDSQDLSKTRLRDYYGHIGYLTQDPSVFDGTILENLTYGARSEVSEEDLQKAIELAQCDFIHDFRDGLRTEIGEKGVRLSGGQRQRLAIAKIFIKNPEIIILDEPTSALDSFSEEKINIAFHNLFRGRTVIVIAHRLQTVKEADEILVLEHGRIAEQGTHATLVEHGGVYAKMLELQSGF